MVPAASSVATSIWSCWEAWHRWRAVTGSICSRFPRAANASQNMPPTLLPRVDARSCRWLVFLAIAAQGNLIGCGRKANVAPVSGRVTLNGDPLANVAVNFGPLTGGLDGAYAAYGKT